MANPLLTDEQRRRLASQNDTYNQIMKGFEQAEQQQQPNESWFSGLARGAKAGLGGLGAGLLHAGQGAFGTDGSAANALDAMAENNAPRRDWDLADTFSWDYLTSPEGLPYGLGQIAGSMAIPALFGAGVAAAVPSGGASLAGMGALIGAAGAAPMAISEGGNTYAQGLKQGMSEEEAKKAGLIDAGIKLPFYMLSEGLSGKVAQGLVTKGLLDAEGKSLGRRVAEGAAKVVGNAANEAYEEGTENRSSAYALGDPRIGSLANVFNPFDWNDEDKAQGVGVFTPTLALGALTGGAGHLRNRFSKKNNNDVSAEVDSEGGTIEDGETNNNSEENFWENTDRAKQAVKDAYKNGLLSKEDARNMLVMIDGGDLGRAENARLKKRARQLERDIEARRLQGYEDELEGYTNSQAAGKEAFINAIAGQESGGNYEAVNGRTGAAGKYQIMPENWPAWAEEAGLGADAEMTPENQEIVARYKLGEYYDKYGPRGAAMAWYAGEGSLNYSEEALNRKQGKGDEPSINEYADSVLARMGNYADTARIDDSEENYFDESNYTDQSILDATRGARGFDVSHLNNGEASDAESLRQFDELSPEVKAQREADERRKQFNKLMDELRAAGDPQRAAQYGFERQNVSADPLARPFGEESLPGIDTQKPFNNKIQTNLMRKRGRIGNAVSPDVQFEQGQFLPSLMQMARSPREMANVTNFELMNQRSIANKNWEQPQQTTPRYDAQAVDALLAEQQREEDRQKLGLLMGGMRESRAVQQAQEQSTRQSERQSLAEVLGRIAGQKWDAAQQNYSDRKQANIKSLADVINARAAQQWDKAQNDDNVKQTQAQALVNLLNAKAAGQYDAAQQEYAGRAKQQSELQKRMQALANIVNARAAQKWDEVPTAEKFKFVPQRRSMYDGAMRRNLVAQDRIKPDEQPSVKPTPVNRRALEGRNFVENVIAAGRKDYENGKRSPVLMAGQRRKPKLSVDARMWRRQYQNDKTQREALRDAAISVWQGDPKHPMKECRRLLNLARNMRKEILQPIVDNMTEQGIKQGVEFIPIEDRRMMRESHNAMWYRNYYKENKKAPSQTAMYDIAEDIFLGRGDKYSVGYYSGIDGKGLQQIAKDNHAELDYINNAIEAYETLELKLKENPNYGKEWATGEKATEETGGAKTSRNSEAAEVKAEPTAKTDKDEVKAEKPAKEKKIEKKPEEQVKQQVEEKQEKEYTEDEVVDKIVESIIEAKGNKLYYRGKFSVDTSVEIPYGIAKRLLKNEKEVTVRDVRDYTVRYPASTESMLKAIQNDGTAWLHVKSRISGTGLNSVQLSSGNYEAELAYNDISNKIYEKLRFRDVKAEVNINAKTNEFEIKFNKMPSDTTRGKLKGAGYKWNKEGQLWHAEQNSDSMAMAEKLGYKPVEKVEEPAKKPEQSQVKEVKENNTQEPASKQVKPSADIFSKNPDALFNSAAIDKISKGEAPKEITDIIEKMPKDNSEQTKSKKKDSAFNGERAKGTLDKLFGKKKTKAPKANDSIKVVDVFDESKLDDWIKKAKDSLKRLNANPMFDPDLMNALFHVGGIYAQKGINKFADWSRIMVGALGEKVKPYLTATWKCLGAFKGDNVDSEVMQAVMEYVGSETEKGRSIDEVQKELIDAYGEELKPYIQPAYVGVQNWGSDTSENVVESKQDNTEGGNENGNNKTRAGSLSESGQSEQVQGTESGEQTGRVPGQSDEQHERPLQRPENEPAKERPSTRGSNGTGSVSAYQGQGENSAGTAGRGTVPLTPAQKKDAKPSETPGHNYTVTKDSLGDGGVKTKYQNNVKAIKLLKQLEAEGRAATPAEQEILANYVGWGGLSPVFNINYHGEVMDSSWAKEAKELKELLTDEEYRAARASTTTAFYTPVSVIKNIYKALDRIGFKGGKVLEPSMGTGNFFGAMPESMRSKSSLNGVELDPLTGRIAKQLYQKANIEITGFEKANFPDGYFDLAISNVPFGNFRLSDSKYDKYGLNIHNYFFAKAMDKVRPGGLVCFVTSTDTMQGRGDSAKLRQLLKGKADFVGAIRLPDTTFKANANTEVTSDVIILQKRKEGAVPSKFTQEWLNTVPSGVKGKYGDELEVNEYYKNHPEMVIGELKAGGQWGSLIVDGRNVDVAKDMAKAVKKLPANIYEAKTSNRNNNSVESAQKFLAPSNSREGALIAKDGKVYHVEQSQMVEMPKTVQKKALDYVGLRDTAKKLLAEQVNPSTTDEQLAKTRAELNKAYDKFVKEYGPVNDPKNIKKLSIDPDYGVLEAIEDYKVDPLTNKVTVTKRAIFSQRTVNPVKNITHADNVNDALTLSMSQTGGVDLEYMSNLMDGKSRDSILKELGDRVYENPATNGVELAEAYLSGNVREKLEFAETAAKTDKRFERNVEALKKIQPKGLEAEDVSISLGAPWVPASDIQAFTAHLFGNRFSYMDIKYIPAAGTWKVDWGEAKSEKGSVAATQTWGTKARNVKDLLEAALNQRTPTVYETDIDGKSHVDTEATIAAQAKLREIQEEFKKWIWTDKSRTERLLAYYNRNFNNWVLRNYDGSALTFPGYSTAEPQLKQHQKDVVWRILQDGTCLMAHCVGAGKTWSMQTAAMELKRLGLANKSMFVIPNHMLQQFENEFRRIYPNAKLLTISSDTLPDVNVAGASKLSKAKLAERKAAKNAKRQSILGKIATEDWDGIIISHNIFKRIPMSPEAYNRFYEQQIEEVEQAILDISASAGGRRNNSIVKTLEKTKKGLEAKLKKNVNEEAKDIVIPFEQLGVDQIFVDEADQFKNLYFATKMQNIAGMSQANSQRSMDMFMKTQYLINANNGRGVVFATGTPISNTMAEMFTMLRYLDNKGLKEKNLSFFDNWAATFATKETTAELAPDGSGYRIVDKFTKFNNMPELVKMFRKVADVKKIEDLDLEIPKLKNGKPTVVEIPMNSALETYIKETAKKRAAAIHNKRVDPTEDNMLKLTGDLRKASLDMRLVDPSVPASVASGKINAVVDHVADKYKETKDVSGVQLVFCDLSTPKGVSDKINENDTAEVKEEAEDSNNITVYAEIKKGLIKKGIPANQIAFIHDAKNKTQKEQLFERCRQGQIRVLIGSTEKMGAGTNIQNKLVAEHHVDAPWRPRDIEQREGRILRQGNENKEVEIFNYVTKGSFDANMWEKLKNKATMIGQAMSGNLAQRSIEDADATVLSFAEVEALASGNPLMAERVMVNAKLTQYEALAGNYRVEQAKNKRRLAELPNAIKLEEDNAGKAQNDIKKRVDISGDNFSMIIGRNKNVYTNRKDAKAELERIASHYSNELGGVVAKAGGFDIRFRAIPAGKLFATNDGKVYTASENTVRAEIVGEGTYYCEPTLGSIEHAIMHAPDKALEMANKEVAQKRELMKQLEAKVNEPFKYADEYEALKKRSAEIEEELEDVANSNSDVKAEIKKLFPVGDTFYHNGKPIIVERIGKSGKEYHIVTHNDENNIEEWIAPYNLTKTKGGEPVLSTEEARRLFYGNTQYSLSDEDDISINPNESYIQPINDVEPEKVKRLVKSFEEKGYSGRPIIVLDNGGGDYLAITGSHRIEAAKQADIELQAIVLENNEDTAELFEANNDDEREAIAKRLYEDGIISKKVRDIIVAENENNGEYSTADEATTRSRAEVETEIKKALPSARLEQRADGSYIATMPNGKKLGIVIEDQILLNEQQAAEAGRAHNRTADEAEGYWNSWERLEGKNVDGVLRVSRNSRVGTAFHETLHAAMDLCLTSKEKAALYKSFAKKAQESGRSVDEEIADAYKDWALKRQQGKGSMFGKLFQKAKDFLSKLYTMFVEAENKGNIFRKLESGKAWKNNGNVTGASERIRASIAQAISSAETSLNQIPAVFNKIPWKPGTVNIDIGGGRFDKATNFVKEKGVENIVFDPFNRDYDHNSRAFERVKQGGDTVTVANVLNVIAESGARDNVILQAARALKEDGTAYFAIYEGSRDGVGKTTTKGWQNNMKAADYVPEVKKHFAEVRKAGNVIIAKKPILSAEEKAVWSMDDTFTHTVKYSVAPGKNKIASAFTNTERKGAIQSAKDFIKEQKKNWYSEIVDKNHILKSFDALTKATGGLSVYDNVQNLPSTTAGMLKAICEGNALSIKAANQHLKNVKMKHNVTLAMALDQINKDAMDKAQPKYLAANGFDNWVNAFGAYLGAERLLEMNDLAKSEGKVYKFPKGLTEAELKAFTRNVPPQFRKAADMFYKVNDNMISVMEDAQVFSPELAKALRTKYKKYCPLLRDFSDTAAADTFINGLTEGGRGIGNVSIPLKKINIEGSERGVMNPLESVLKSYAVMLNRAERNKVGLMAVNAAKTAQLHDLIKEMPEKKDVKGNVVNAVADPKNCIFTVLVNGKKKAYQTTQELYAPIVGYNLPAAGLCINVARMAAHMLRTGATMSPSFIVRNLLRDTVFAGISSKNGFIPIVDSIRGAMALWNDHAMRAEFEAAGVTEFNFYGSQNARIKSLDAMAGEKPVGLWEMIKWAANHLEAASDFVESSTRMGEYMKARKNGLSMEEAARAAREVTLDFSRSGVVGEQVNRYVPFFNACIQGGDKMVRLLKEDPRGTSQKLFQYIVLPSLFLWAMNHDEDWYKDLDPDVKNNYWCLGENLRIPKPQEAGVLFGSGIEALLDQANGKDKDALKNMAKAWVSNMVPGIVPTLFLPLLEWQANYSFFKGRALVGSKYQRLPDELQYNDYTSELSKAIGNNPLAKVSPMKIDNLIRGYTGTMGALLWSAPDAVIGDSKNLPEKRLSERAFFRDFALTDANKSRPMNNFYDILDKANRQHAGYGVKGKPAEAVKSIRSAGNMISKIRKDIDKITHSNLTPERKRELIGKLKEKMNQIAKKATERYGKYFE